MDILAPGTGTLLKLSAYNVNVPVKFHTSDCFFSFFLLKKELNPEEYKEFKDKIVIKKSDVRKYEAELKDELLNWITSGHSDQVLF